MTLVFLYTKSVERLKTVKEIADMTAKPVIYLSPIFM